MKKLLIFISAIAFVSISCKSNREDRTPDNIIPRDTLTHILAETYLIESEVHEGLHVHEQKQNATRMLYNELFKKHNITQQDFEQSVHYYLSKKEMAEPFLRECDSILMTMKDDFIGPADSTSLPQ